MEDTAMEYISLEEAAVNKGSWISHERDPDYDLGLDMAYSRLRTSVNKVKYGRIENRRHSAELNIYTQWLAENRDRLSVSVIILTLDLIIGMRSMMINYFQAGTVGLVEGLLTLARDKVERSEEILAEYVSLLRTGAREEAGTRASRLESLRGEKRGVMRDLVRLVKHEGRQAQLELITFRV